jgi:hypothetical protein
VLTGSSERQMTLSNHEDLMEEDFCLVEDFYIKHDTNKKQ